MVTALWGRAYADQRVLVIGVPRSGTTWVGSVLSRAPGAVYVHEPDNPDVNPAAAAALKDMWRRGPLSVEAEVPDAFEGLWNDAFSPRREARFRRTPGAVIVKSVRAHLSLEWIAARWGPQVIVIRANPLSVLSSWLRLGWPAMQLTAVWLEQYRPDLLEAVGGWPTDPVAQVAVEIGVKARLQEELLAQHPAWISVSHEDLCADPVAGFEDIFEMAGLDFTDDVRAFVESTNAPGARHETTRIHSQAARRFERLDPDDRARALAVFERLPLASGQNKSAGLMSGAPVP